LGLKYCASMSFFMIVFAIFSRRRYSRVIWSSRNCWWERTWDGSLTSTTTVSLSSICFCSWISDYFLRLIRVSVSFISRETTSGTLPLGAPSRDRD
jgi:hypothetical protein